MLLSTSGSRSGRPELVRLAIAEHGPEHVDPPAREGNQRLVVPLALTALALVEGAAGRTVERAEGRLIKDALEHFVATERPAQEAHLARLAQHGGEPRRCCEGIGTGEAGQTACLDEEFARERDPHPGQAQDEGPVRVASEPLGELLIEDVQARSGVDPELHMLREGAMPARRGRKAE